MKVSNKLSIAKSIVANFNNNSNNQVITLETWCKQAITLETWCK